MNYYGYIYKTTNLINEKFYIGQHTNPWVRKHQKIDSKYFGSGTYLKNAIEEYGIENFKCEIIEWCCTEDELNERELFWIDNLKALHIYGNYNLINRPYIKRDKINRPTFAKYNAERDYSELSDHNKGSKMMHNSIEQKWVYKDDIQKMLKEGWVFGSCKKRNRIYKEPWNKGKKGIQKNCKSVPGYIRVTNGKINTTIRPELLEEYLKKGYWKGITRKK